MGRMALSDVVENSFPEALELAERTLPAGSHRKAASVERAEGFSGYTINLAVGFNQGET